MSQFNSGPTAGIVYILTNEAMPGYIKIGRTDGDLTVRVRQLDSTGVPLPFEVFYAARVADSVFVERQLHAAFGDRRVRSNREFFTVEPSRVRAALELAGLEEVTPGREVVETADDRRALEVAKQRRSNFRFSMIGIGPGSVLLSTFDNQIACEVVDDRTVRFREQLTSLSDAARQISAEKGRGDQARQGPLYWTSTATSFLSSATLSTAAKRLDLSVASSTAPWRRQQKRCGRPRARSPMAVARLRA